MTSSNNNQHPSLSLEVLVSYVSSIVYGKENVPIQGQLFEEIIEKKYLVTGINGLNKSPTVGSYFFLSKVLMTIIKWKPKANRFSNALRRVWIIRDLPRPLTGIMLLCYFLTSTWKGRAADAS